MGEGEVKPENQFILTSNKYIIFHSVELLAKTPFLLKRLNDATNARALRAFVAGIGRFPNDAVEDRALGALAVDPGHLPGVPTVAKPGHIVES